MKPHVSAITLGVADLGRSKAFYGEGLGWPIDQDYPAWAAFGINGGSALLGLYPRATLANEAGVAPEGSGFQGVVFNYVVRTEDRVGGVLAEAERAGGSIARAAEKGQWGGTFGYFTDPDGFLWKVAAGAGNEPYAAE